MQFPEIDYRGFIEKWFYIRTKEGLITRFIFNEPQNIWYDDLLATYGKTLQGIRENDLKGRQFGISSVISGIFTVDFILSSLGEIPMIDGDIYSHKDKETASHFNRVNMYTESYLLGTQGGDYADPEHRLEAQKLRPYFLKTDTTNLLIAKNGTQIQTATAGAKVSGRGSTRQNLHWSEPAFYPNTPILSAETLVTGAEEQVPDGFGKIFRESTGNMLGDFYSNEYFAGKEGRSEFNSRFLAWYLMKSYRRTPPAFWEPPAYYEKLLHDGQATIEQCYWHFVKTRELKNLKRLREYPTYDYEAFLMAGTTFFDSNAMLYHKNNTREPLKTAPYINGLTNANIGKELARV
jgi:hypothetical protein